MNTLRDGVAVESIVVGWDAGPRDEDGNTRVVQATEEAVDSLGMVAEEVEEGRAGEADHGSQEETEEHGLLHGWELVDFNVLKQESDVVAVHIDPQAEH